MAIETYFEDIADAIRERGGTAATLTPAQMPQAILDIPGGSGSEIVANWDLSVSTIDSVNNLAVTLNNVTALQNVGYEFLSDYAMITLPISVRNSGYTYELDIGDMNLVDSSHHKRMFVFRNNAGFIFRNNGKWSFYDGNGWSTDSNITDFDYFANSTMGIFIDIKSQWHIYKNGNLVYTPDTLTLIQESNTNNIFGIGATIGQAAREFVLKGIKIYQGNPYT